MLFAVELDQNNSTTLVIAKQKKDSWKRFDEFKKTKKIRLC